MDFVLTIIDVIELLDRFQTSIVGVIGFCGVIWTLWANAKHDRETHERQLATKRQTLRRILAAEFRNYARALKKNLEGPTPDSEFISIGRVRRLLSESLSADLGLLNLDEVDIIVNAIISLDGMNHFLANHAAEISETRFLIPVTTWDEVKYCLTTTNDALDGAIEALALTGEV